MEIRQMKLFRMIADAGSMSGASESAHMAQPNISYQMKQMEEELGIALIERKHSGISLTPAGKILYERAGMIIELEEAAEREVIHTGQTQILRLGMTYTISPFAVPILNGFSKKYPDVRFDIHDGNTFTLLELLKKRIIDIALIRTPANLENLDVFTVRHEQMLAATSPQHVCTEKTVTLPQLAKERLVLYRRYHDLYMNAFRLYNINPDILCWCDDARTSMLFAENGMGTALYPVSMCEKNDPLTYRTIDCPALETDIILAKEKKYQSSETAEKFITFIKQASRD